MITFDRPLPKNVEIEQFVAGCLLVMDDEQERLEKCAIRLKSEDFTELDCKKIVKAVLLLLSQKRAVDTTAVYDAVQENFVFQFVANIATTALLEAKINELKRLTSERDAIQEAAKLINAVHNSEDPIAEIRSAGERLHEYANYAETGLGKIEDAAKVISEMTTSGFSSGFITHDYNDSGFRPGTVTILTGFRGDGKTTIARQMVMSAAMQRISSFNFIGESSISIEKNAYAKLCALPGELHATENIGGRKVYQLSDRVEQRFNQQFEGLIHICDTSIAKNKSQMFDVVLAHSEQLARDAGVKLFMLDNMMILNRKKESAKFAEQERITESLKNFAETYQVSVILIAHQAKGQTTVSGVAEQENLVDTILRYVRFKTEKEKRSFVDPLPLPDVEKEHISAVLLNEKIRVQGGTQLPLMLQFDGVKSACVEVSGFPKAVDYQQAGYWVRAVGRFDEDIPEKNKNLPYKDN